MIDKNIFLVGLFVGFLGMLIKIPHLLEKQCGKMPLDVSAHQLSLVGDLICLWVAPSCISVAIAYKLYVVTNLGGVSTMLGVALMALYATFLRLLQSGMSPRRHVVTRKREDSDVKDAPSWESNCYREQDADEDPADWWKKN